MFHKARRGSVKLRLALMGPAGSGKTYSVLTIAKGLGGRIAMIDTERGSGELYAHLCEYDVVQLVPPYSPDKYVAAIRNAQRADYNVLIIDSLSHAWSGPGGVLDIQDGMAKAMRSTSAAWREVMVRHDALVEAMLGASCHVIVTMRTKTAYEVQHDGGGKARIVRVGLAPVQCEGLEYEFTAVFDLAVDGHIATASKDRTGLFDGELFTPSEETGKTLRGWLGLRNQLVDLSREGHAARATG